MRAIVLSLLISLGAHAAIFWPWQKLRVGSPVQARSSASALSITVVAPVDAKAQVSRPVKTTAAVTSGSPGVVQTAPQLIGELAPEYPWLSRANAEEGSVELTFLITAQGHAYDIRIISSSGFSRLDESAINAVKAARFSNDTDGAQMNISLNFKLREP